MGAPARFREFLRAKHEKARLENRLFNWAWVGGKCACWRPIKSYRAITRGRKKGQVEVELYYPIGCKRIVPLKACKFVEEE